MTSYVSMITGPWLVVADFDDPLSDLMLTTRDYEAAFRRILEVRALTRSFRSSSLRPRMRTPSENRTLNFATLRGFSANGTGDTLATTAEQHCSRRR